MNVAQRRLADAKTSRADVAALCREESTAAVRKDLVELQKAQKRLGEASARAQLMLQSVGWLARIADRCRQRGELVEDTVASLLANCTNA